MDRGKIEGVARRECRCAIDQFLSRDFADRSAAMERSPNFSSYVGLSMYDGAFRKSISPTSRRISFRYLPGHCHVSQSDFVTGFVFGARFLKALLESRKISTS